MKEEMNGKNAWKKERKGSKVTKIRKIQL